MLNTQGIFHCIQSVISKYIRYLMLQISVIHVNPIVLSQRKYILVSCPDPKRVEFFLKDTIAFSERIENNGDQVCYPCYKVFQSDAQVRCMHAGQCGYNFEFHGKERTPGKIVHEFEYITPEGSDIVEYVVSTRWHCMHVS